MNTYKIVRFYQNKSKQDIIETGLTLEEAKKHCNRRDTEGKDWFDGFTKE